MKHLLLYAEDDKEIAELYINDFRDNGYEVAWAKDGQKAVELYKKYAPDLVLLDIDMPGLNGYQVAEEIRRKDPDTPVIFLTSFSASGKAIKGLDIGANDYIRKDVDVDELLARIRGVIQRHPVKQSTIIQITPDTSLNIAVQKLNSFDDSYDLSFRDCNLLHLLVLNKNVPQKREQIILRVWGENENGKSYMNKSISLLRKLMDGDRRIRLIANRGGSIMLIVDD
jgi:DNA-binding response OmpR family regulator